MKACEGTGGLIGRLRAVALLVVALTAVLVAGVFGAPSAAYAEDVATPIGAVQCDGKNFYPSNFKAINDELAKLKGKTVTIEMYRDWNARDTSGNGVSIPEQLVIPSGTRVTLNMNGYMIDRGLTGEAKDTSVSYGMVILVQSGAALTVNGGSSNEAKARSHEAYVFTSTEPSGFVAPSKKSFSGGLITGGNDKINAGGICMQKGSTVTLNDVTIAGCRDQSASNSEGTGGGVRMEGGDTALNMNNSTITGCFADHGGGLYVDNAGKATIKLEDSRIENNYAKQDGGGIYLNGQNDSITGSGDSSVSNNHCTLNGGGIHAFGSKAKIQGITVQGNSARDGGGICARNDSIALRTLVVTSNTASAHGGGVCFVSDAATSEVYEGDSVVSDCAIQNNTAQTCGGLYFDDYTNLRKERKRAIAGETTVKNNTSTGGGVKDLLIETDAWNHKRESFALAEGFEVWAGYQAVSDKTIADDVKNDLVTDGKCNACLHSEHEGLTFRFDLEKRFIDLVSASNPGTGATAEPVTAVSANNASGKTGGAPRTNVAGKTGTVGSGGESGSDYDLIRGFYMHDNETDIAAFYYSDGLFYDDPKTYNTHLATLSWAWAYAGGYLNQNKDPFDHKSTSNTDASTYYNKHAAARQFLADIGCADQDIYVNDSMVSKPGTDTIGVAIGSKKLQHYVNGKLEDTGDILIPVAVRGMGYETEWMSNVTLDLATEVPGAEARGFANAADQVVKEIEYYLKKYNLEDEFKSGHVKFWVTGFSRAGATANLTSKRLVDKILTECTGDKSQVFAYPCEAPKGGTDSADEGLKNDDERYFCIHNMINAVDLVPYVAPEQMGFKRYGVDHYIPGTGAGTPVKKTEKTIAGGGTGGPTKVTTYADNEPTLTKTEEYKTQKSKMIPHLTALDSSFVFDDYFRPMALDFVSVSQLQTMRIYNEPNNNDNDGYNKAEYFVEDFMRFLQQGPPDETWGKAVSSRDAYAKTAFTLSGKSYATIQTALRDLVKLVMGSSDSKKAEFLNKAGNIMNNIPAFTMQVRWTLSSGDPSFSLASLYFNVIGNWHKLDDNKRSYWVTSMWNAFKKTGALGELSADEQAKFEASFPTILNLAFNFVDGDYKYKPKNNGSKGFPAWAVGSNETMMYTPTFMEYSPYIISCHMPQVNTAWTRTYDSWFNNELDGYALEQPGNVDVDAPKAYGPANGNQANVDTGQTGADGNQAGAGQSGKAGVELVEGAGKTNRLAGSVQRITLENPDIVGEAIYYDLIDQTNNKTLATNQIYRGGIDLSLDGASSRRFQIKTYDMSYGVPSGEVVYNVELYTGKHTVTVKDLTGSASAGALGTQSTGAQAMPQGSGDGEHNLIAGSIADPTLLQAQEADAGAYRTRTFSFAEGAKAVVQADCPDDLFFKEWKVVSKKADGSNASSDLDLSNDAFQPATSKKNSTATFTMPTSSSDSAKFPSGYQLELTAQYGMRIKAIETLVSAPVAGSSLPGTLKATFPNGTQKEYPITWAYKDGNTVVPAHADSGDEQPKAYKNTEYVATIVVPQDTQSDIAFAKSVNVSSSVVTQGETTTEAKTAQRNDDGSITIQLSFPQTGDGGEASPQITQRFAVNAIDMNTGQSLAPAVQYNVLPNKLITITAPDVEDEQFVGWNLGSTGITTKDPSEENLKEKVIALRMPSELGTDTAITAQYVPLVKKVEVNLRDKEGNLFEPKSGKSNFANAEAFVTITNEYEINPDNLQVTWSPALPDDDTYDTMTDYVATVKIVPDNAGKVKAKPKGGSGEWRDVALVFIPSDDMRATFNGSDQDVCVDEDEVTASKVFPKTLYTLDAVKQPDNIDGVQYGKGEEGIRALLPTTTKILATNGFEVDADIEWGTITVVDGAGDAYDSKVWLANGAVKQPSNFENPNDVSLGVSLYVTVDEADTALAPSATLDSGTYLYDQMTMLSTDEKGGKIYYTLDGSDPADAGNPSRILYDEDEEIPISRLDASLEQVPISRIEAQSEDGEDTYEYADRKAFYIRACTEVAGKRSSAVAMYRYEFDNIPVPEAQNYDYDAEEHIGVEAGPYYKLSVEPGSRARVDEYGNVVATVPGTYKVTASLLLDDDLWALDDEGATSNKDQTIEFKIAGNPLSEEEICDIGVEAVPAEAGNVVGGGSYVKGQAVEVKAWANDGYEFVNWTLDGKEVSSDANYEFTASDDCNLVANFRSADDLYYCAEGSGGTWTKGSNEELAFTFKRSEADETTYGNFVGIEVDGAAVPEKDASGVVNYTAAGGSVIVSLQPSYLETLSVGDHVVKALFNDGEAQASFSVVEKSAPAPNPAPTPASATTKPAASANAAPKSGDALANLALLCVAVGCIAAGLVVYSKRRS